MGTGTTVLAFMSFLAASQAAPNDISYINEREFKIPITLPADPAARADIDQLQLYVSKDQGRTWQQEAIATPRQESFPFFAPGDGVYWFSVSFTDKQKRTHPADISSVPPALKVVIDSRKPLIKLQAGERQGDLASFSWDIREDFLDAATLKLEYKTADSPNWRPVPGASPALTNTMKFSAGTAGAVTIRMQVSDLAGNTGMSQLEIPGEGNAGVAARPDATPPSAGPMLPGSSDPSSPPPPENPNWANKPAGGPRMAMESSRPSEGPRGLPSKAFSAIDERSQRVAIATSNPPPPPPKASAPSAPLGPPSGPEAVEPMPATTSYRRNVQFTNSALIDLNYEVSKVGPSGVGEVSLYVTMDEGNTWRPFGEDSDHTPPFGVELPGEGLYGFTLVVRSKAGLGRGAPQPGQQPELRVELDSTPPEAVLYKVEADPRRKDMLFLTWDALDKNLAEKPIRLYWATKPDGPWQPIAVDIPNSGRHAWQMPADLPFKVYLRLQAKDLAGNVANADTPDPVLVDLTEPEGKITGILPSARKP
jgi:hypothetical protein